MTNTTKKAQQRKPKYTPAQLRRIQELRQKIADENRRKAREIGLTPRAADRIGISITDYRHIEIR